MKKKKRKNRFEDVPLKRKQKTVESNHRVENYRPPKQKPPKVMRLLQGWNSLTLTVMDDKKHGHVIEYVRSDKGRVYRKALPWENPSLLIGINFNAPQDDVRLVRIKDPKIIKGVKRALRRNRSR
jgi:hypothetical protein